MAEPKYKERLKSTGRNDACPCGSGKKYKKCHLQADEKKASEALARELEKAAAESTEEEGTEEKAESPAHPPETRGRKDEPWRPRSKPVPAARQVSTPRKSGAS